MGKILIYYKYVHLEDPTHFAQEQRSLCLKLGLKGRILIAHEGINGTVGGSADAIENYKHFMQQHLLFNNIDFKTDNGDATCFPRLQVTVKKEIVNFGVPKERLSTVGTHLTPGQAHELMTKNPDNLIVFDARNAYESAIGTFKNAITPSIKNFRDLPHYIDENRDLFKDKQVLMFCTGGIRCEKASSYLVAQGVAQQVYQLEGGICRYVEAYPDGYFRGKNYVFDGRVTVRVTNEILAQCLNCKIPYDDYTNCINATCNKQIILCATCVSQLENTCNQECLKLVKEQKVVIRTKPKKITYESSTTGTQCNVTKLSF